MLITPKSLELESSNYVLVCRPSVNTGVQKDQDQGAITEGSPQDPGTSCLPRR